MNLLALTPCCVDYYPQRNQSFLGGNSLNVASMWKTLEPSAHVSVITALGTDANAEMILHFLQEKHIDITHVYQLAGTTACNKLRVDEDGERYGIEGSWNGGVYETFLLSENDWTFVSQQNIVAMPGNNPNFREMIQRKNSNQVLSVDYLDVLNHIPLEESIGYTDIAFVAATPDLLTEYKNLAFARNKLIVVTLGAKGSYAFMQGNTYFQPAVKVDKVIDTTGCGDAYQAAFALIYFTTKDIAQSMLAGAKAASVVLQAWGGVG